MVTAIRILLVVPTGTSRSLGGKILARRISPGGKPSFKPHPAELAEAKKVPFLIPYGWNYSKLAALGRKAIADGVVGDLEHVLCHMGSPLRDLLSGTGAGVAERSMFKPNLGTWDNPSTGGGFAHGQLTHALGLMLWITGLQASQVFAMVGRSAGGSDLYNSIHCRFTNGATGMRRSEERRVG